VRGAHLLFLFALAACDEPAGLPKQDVCDSICSCIYGLPAQIDQCNQACLTQLPDPTPACQTCVDDATCSGVNDCFQVCFGSPKENL